MNVKNVMDFFWKKVYSIFRLKTSSTIDILEVNRTHVLTVGELKKTYKKST